MKHVRSSIRILNIGLQTAALLLGSARPAGGAAFVEFLGFRNGRVEPDFRANAQTVNTFLGHGDRARILEVVQIPGSGNFALRVQVTQSNTGRPGFARPPMETWVHFNRNNPNMNLFTREGQQVQDPVAQLNSRVTDAMVAGTATAQAVVSPTPSPIVRPVIPALRPQQPTCTDPNLCGPGVRPTQTSLQMRPSSRQILGEPIVEWDECHPDQPLSAFSRWPLRDPDTGRNTQCARRRPMSAAYMSFYEQTMPACMNQAARVINPSWEVVHTDMVHLSALRENATVSGRNGRRHSLHAVGRALDVRELHITLANGQRFNVDYMRAMSNPRGPERRFFQALRDCWERANQNRGCRSFGNREHRCSLGWEDRNHQDHLHLSMPYCPEKPGFAQI